MKNICSINQDWEKVAAEPSKDCKSKIKKQKRAKEWQRGPECEPERAIKSHKEPERATEGASESRIGSQS